MSLFRIHLQWMQGPANDHIELVITCRGACHYVHAFWGILGVSITLVHFCFVSTLPPSDLSLAFTVRTIRITAGMTTAPNLFLWKPVLLHPEWREGSKSHDERAYWRITKLHYQWQVTIVDPHRSSPVQEPEKYRLQSLPFPVSEPKLLVLFLCMTESADLRTGGYPLTTVRRHFDGAFPCLREGNRHRVRSIILTTVL